MSGRVTVWVRMSKKKEACTCMREGILDFVIIDYIAVAICCSVLQCATVCCSALQCVAVCCRHPR